MRRGGWTVIVLAYPGKCIRCGLWIARGTQALWLKGIGVKHLPLDCPKEEDE